MLSASRVINDDSEPDRLTIGAVVGGVLAAECCAGLPNLAAVIAAFDGVAFRSMIAAALLVILGWTFVRRRRDEARAHAQWGAAG